MTEHSPARLIARLVAGDERALGALYDAYGPVAYGLAFAITGAEAVAESVVSESFAEAYHAAASFDASRTSVLAWLTAIVRRRALERGKSAGRAVNANRVMDAVESPTGPRPVVEALRMLTASQRQVIELSYYRGFTLRQIATHLGEPETGARELLRSAMHELRAALSGIAGRAIHEDQVVTRA